MCRTAADPTIPDHIDRVPVTARSPACPDRVPAAIAAQSATATRSTGPRSAPHAVPPIGRKRLRAPGVQARRSKQIRRGRGPEPWPRPRQVLGVAWMTR